MKTNYRTDRTIKINHKRDVELIYNALSDVYMLRAGWTSTFYDTKKKANEAYAASTR